MPKNVEKMTLNYSPNFDLKKRTKSKVKYLILHYTGMKSENAAIRKLTDSNSKVSCHYLIKKSGDIIQMVPDLYVAWHAGVSFWKKDRSLNSKSIGIEISNPGHQYGYKNFNKKQIQSIIRLSKSLINKYNIKIENVLGHSDIAPLRKKDPGEKFPWELLAKKKICLWHKINKNRCKNYRGIKIKPKIEFYKLLYKMGYMIVKTQSEKKKLCKNFQRRFRPELINGIIDKECYSILKSLI